MNEKVTFYLYYMQSGLTCQARFLSRISVSYFALELLHIPRFFIFVEMVLPAAYIANNRFIFAVAPPEGAYGLRTVIYFFAFGYYCHFMASVAPANVMYLFNAVNAHIVNSFENIAPSGARVGSLGERESGRGRLCRPDR